VDLITLAAHPDEAASVFFLVTSLVWCFSICCYREKELKMAESVDKEREQLSKEFEGTVNEVHGFLHGMSESNACMAEQSFKALLRYFQQFLKGMKGDAQKLEELHGDNISQAFRHFVSAWLAVFEQCTLDPLNHPRRVITDRELAGCGTIAEIVDEVNARLSASKISLIGNNLLAFKKKIVKADSRQPNPKRWIGFQLSLRFNMTADVDEDDPENIYPLDFYCGCLRVTMLSAAHFRLVIFLALGSALMALEIAWAKWLMAAVVCVGLICQCIILIACPDFDPISRLKIEIRNLRKERQDVLLQHQDMKNFFGKIQTVTNLWLYRTVPRLENFKMLHEQILDTPLDHRMALLKGVSEKLELLDADMKPSELFCGENALPESKLELVSEGINSCTKFLEELRGASYTSDVKMVDKICMSLGRVLCCIYVQGLAATNLKNKNNWGDLLGYKSNCYVTLRLQSSVTKLEAPRDQPLPRTQTIEDSEDPDWEGEDFFFPAQILDDQLELHVWHEHATTSQDSSSLGYALINFRTLGAGCWHRCRQPLISMQKKKATESTLEFQIYLATSVSTLTSEARESPSASKPRLPKSVTSFLRF